MERQLIQICGISGAGKTTLTGKMLERYPSLRYLQTYATRAPRPGEEHTFEHIFVSKERYNYLRSQSKIWNHLDIYSAYYGIDIEFQLKKYSMIQNFITIVSPLSDYIAEMKAQFPGKSYMIYFDVEHEIASDRIGTSRPVAERARISVDKQLSLDSIKSSADFVFTPRHILEEDIATFARLIGSLLLVSSEHEHGPVTEAKA